MNTNNGYRPPEYQDDNYTPRPLRQRPRDPDEIIPPRQNVLVRWYNAFNHETAPYARIIMALVLLEAFASDAYRPTSWLTSMAANLNNDYSLKVMAVDAEVEKAIALGAGLGAAQADIELQKALQPLLAEFEILKKSYEMAFQRLNIVTEKALTMEAALEQLQLQTTMDSFGVQKFFANLADFTCFFSGFLENPDDRELACSLGNGIRGNMNETLRQTAEQFRSDRTKIISGLVDPKTLKLPEMPKIDTDKIEQDIASLMKEIRNKKG